MAKMKFRVEPDLQYCPQCHDEYRAGIEKCAECGVELLSGQRMLEILEQQNGSAAKRSTPISPDDELVDVIKGQIINVKNVQALLKSEGLATIIAGDSASCGKGCCGPEVMLRVRKDDLREVMQVLSMEHAHSTGLFDHDTSYVDSVYNTESREAVCPACGSSFSTGSNTCPECGLCF